MKLTTRQSLLTTAVVSAVAAAQPALAQLEEVVVTAEFREASLQDTAIAMEAFDAEAIERRGVMTLTDLFDTAAGVQGYEAPASRGNISLNIRGVGSGNSNALWQDPANALYVDGVFIGKGTANGIDAMDLERVEILRGPQGTLYGRNSTGGAVNFITKKPTDQFGMDLKVSAGNFNYSSYQGRVNVPLSDDLSVAVSAYTRDRDPFYDNSNSDVTGFENIDRQGYRVAVQFAPSDTFTVNYSYANDEIDELSQMQNVVGLNPNAAGILGAEGVPSAVTILSGSRAAQVGAIGGGVAQALQFGFLPPLPQLEQFVGWTEGYQAFSADRLANYDSRTAQGSTDTDSFNLSEAEMHSLTLTWDVSDSLQVKSITGYRDVLNRQSSDLDGMDNSAVGGVQHDLILSTIGGLLFGSVPIPGLDAASQFGLGLSMIGAINANGKAPVYNFYSDAEFDQFSQEIQFIGSTQNVDYVAGLYYYEDEGRFENRQNATFPLAGTSTTSYDNASEAFAVFGEATWHLDKWDLTAGLRYTEETKDVTYNHRGNPDLFTRYFTHVLSGNDPATFNPANGYVDNSAPADSIAPRAFFGETASQDFDNLSGRLTVKYNFSDDLNMYGTYSTGYRSGGFNGENYAGGPDSFNEEEMTNYEIGIKSTLFDGKVRFNYAAFLYEYDNLQINQVQTTDGRITSGVGNAGDAERGGAELSLTWQVTEGVVANVNYMRLNGNFDTYPANVVPTGASLNMNGIARRGLSPDDQITYSLDWELLRNAKHGLTASINGAWQTETVSIPADTGAYDTNGDRVADLPVAYQLRENQERHIMNARLAWDYTMDSGSMLTVAAWGRNITDEEYRTFGYGFGPDLGLHLHQYGAPATYGLDILYSM